MIEMVLADADRAGERAGILASAHIYQRPIPGGAMLERVAITCSFLLACASGAHADPGGGASGSTRPPASRERLGNTLDRATIQELESDLTVICLEIEQDSKASDEEQAKLVHEYLFVLSAYVDLKKLTIQGAPFVLSGQVLASGSAPTASWAVAELVTNKTPAALKVISPFVVKTLPKFKTFSALCKGPVDELDACIASAIAEIHAKGEDVLSPARVDLVREGDTPEHAETRITLPIRSKSITSQGASATPAATQQGTTAPDAAPKPSTTEQLPPAPRTEKGK